MFLKATQIIFIIIIKILFCKINSVKMDIRRGEAAWNWKTRRIIKRHVNGFFLAEVSFLRPIT